jgi:dTDP-glucose 4,6-dehydratase
MSHFGCMKLLVTGGAGFIGSNFIRSWLSGHTVDTVVNVDLLTYAGDKTSLADVERSAGSRYTFMRADIADQGAVREVPTPGRRELRGGIAQQPSRA